MNERLKLLRKALKLNQLEFAEKIQIGRSTLAGYENGLTNMTDRSIRDICRVFYVNEDWLRTGEGDMFKSKNNTNEELAFQIFVGPTIQSTPPARADARRGACFYFSPTTGRLPVVAVHTVLRQLASPAYMRPQP